MSEEDIVLVRRAYEAFERLDLDVIAALISDDFELDISAHPIPDFPNVGTGKEHLFRFFATYLAGFSNYKVAVVELVDNGEQVAALLHDTASLGDAVVERDFAHTWTFRSGKAVRLQAFTTHAAALEAAGLPE
jgi:ketosteroid isomerase-like protein